VLVLAGEAYGYVDVYHSIKRFNNELRVRYGVPESLSLGVGAMRTPEGVALAPRLRFAF
jgi:hypothetical protein